MKLTNLVVKVCIALFLLLEASVLIAEPLKLADRVDWSAFMARHDLVWTRTPPDWTEGAFLGNGLLGTMIYGDRLGALRWDVGRSDVFDTGNRMGIGRFVLNLDRRVTQTELRLDLWNAEARGSLATTAGTVRWQSLTHSEDPVTVILFEEEGQPGGFSLRFIQHPPITARVLFLKLEELSTGRKDWSRITDEKVLTEIDQLARSTNPEAETGQTGPVQWLRQPFKAGGGYTVAWGQRRRPDGKTLFAFTVDYAAKGGVETDKAVRDVNGALEAEWDAFLTRHRTWWHAYYPESFLSIPDTRMESFYWIQMYKLAAGTRADRPALDLMGPWFWRTRWPRIWWNLNIQLTYWPVYTANRLHIGDSLTRMIDRGRQNLIHNVPERWQADSAAIGRTSMHDCVGPAGDEPGNLTFALHNYWLHCRYSGDEQQLRDGLFPILKRAVSYYLHLLEKGEDGKLHTPFGVSPEYPDKASDTNYDLSLLRWGLRTLLAIDQRLNLNDPEAARWKATLEKLVPFPVDEQTGYMIGKDVPFTKGHRHFSHLFMVYPLHLVDPTNPAEQELIQRSVDNWHARGSLQGYSFTGGSAIASRMGRGEQAHELMNRFLDKYVKANTMYMEAGPVIETPLAGASSIQDMLLQSWTVEPFGTDIRVFPAVPPSWKNVSFRHLRAEGAFLVSAARRDGKTRYVEITSLAGQPCRVRTSLVEPVTARGARDFHITTESAPGGKVTVIDLKKGETVLLVSGADPPQATELAVEPVAPAGPLNSYGYSQN